MSLSTENTPETNSDGKSEFKEDLEYLRNTSFIGHLDYECLKLLVMLSSRIELVPGDQIMVQGEDDGNAFYVISGCLEAVHEHGHSRRINRFERGAFLGGLALLGRLIRIFTVHALEESVVLKIGRGSFQKAIRQYPDNMAKVYEGLAGELVKWDQHLIEEMDVDETKRYVGVCLL